MSFMEHIKSAQQSGFSKHVFDHIRNYLMCAFLLAVGANELNQHTSFLFGLISSQYSGFGIIGISCILITINLYDGISRISKYKYNVIMTVLLLALYVLFSIRVIELTLNFRIIQA